MKTVDIQYLFDNLKDGDVLGFFSGNIFSKIIWFFQQKDKANSIDLVSHVGIVYEVCRDGDILSFKVGEQLIFGGSFALYNITRTIQQGGRCVYSIVFPCKFTKLYLKGFNEPLHKWQIDIGITDQKQQEGKRYAFITLLFVIPQVTDFVYRNCGIKIKFPIFSRKRICSTNVWINLKKTFRISHSDYAICPYPTPEYVMSYGLQKQGSEVFDITLKA